MSVPALGAKALEVASKYAPSALNAAKKYMAVQNRDIDAVAARTGDKGAQDAVLVALSRGGLSGDIFAREANLTADERTRYARIISVMNANAKKAVDSVQLSRIDDSKELVLARAARNDDIAWAMRKLAVSADDLARLIVVLRTISTDDVELFQAVKR